jgi:hypothetical protein
MIRGQGLLKICSDPDMPDRATVYRWLEAHQDFRDSYVRAREALMDFYAEQILVIAFDETGDIMIDQDGGRSKAVANHAKVQRDRLKVDSLKWTVSRLFPKRYGDKMELLGQNDEPKEMKIRWIVTGVPRGDEPKLSGEPAEPKPEPRQLTSNPVPPPADLSPEAWAAIVRVSNLIKQIAPGDEVPEQVFDVIEAALRKHYLA